MADITKTIDIIFGAIDKGVGPTVDAISGQLDQFDKSVQSIAQPVANAVESLIQLEAAIAAAGVAAVAFAVNEAGKFTTSVAEIGTLFGGTSEQVGQFGADILEYSRNSTASIESINTAVYGAISAGVAYSDSLELLRATEQLSAAGRADLGETTRLVTGVLNAYGLETSNAADVSDALFTAIKQGQITLPELNSALAQVTGTAAAAGVPFDDLVAAIAALTASGLPTSQAITGIKAALTNIISPSSEAQKLADSLGVSFGVSALQADGLQGMLQKLSAATGGNIESMSGFFGSAEALNAVMVLSTDSSGKFAAALDAMSSKSGVTQAAFEQMSQTFDAVNQKIANNFQATLINFGQPLLDEYGSIGKAIASIFESLGADITSGNLKAVNDALANFMQEVANTLSGVAQALPTALSSVDYSGLIASFQELGNTIGDVFDQILGADLDLTKPEDLAIALQKAVNIMESLVNVTNGIIQGFDPIFAAIGAAANQLSEAGTDSEITAGKVAGAITLIGEVGTKLGLSLLVIGDNVRTFDSIFTILGGTVKLWANTFTIALAEIGLAVGSILLPPLQAIVYAVNQVAEAFGLDAIAASTADATNKIAGLMDDLRRQVVIDNADMVDAANKVADGWYSLTAPASSLSDSIGRLSDKSTQATTAFKENESALYGNKEAQIEVSAALEGMGLKWDAATGKITEFANASGRTNEEIDGILNSIYGIDAPVGKVVQQFTSLAEAEGYVTQESERLSSSTIRFKDGMYIVEGTLRSTTDATGDYGNEIVKAQEKTDAYTEAQKRAAEQAFDLQMKLVELASDERIKSMEFQMQINVAEIEAQADMVVSAFESMSDAIGTTNDLVGTLFGKDAPDWDPFGWATEAAAKQAMENATNLTNSMIELNQAQIDNLNAKTQMLLEKNGIITINADNLAPELQLVLRHLLEEIQIQANAEGLELIV